MRALEVATPPRAATERQPLDRRIDALAWPRILAELEANGFASIPSLLEAQECAALVAMYPRSELFRSRVRMDAHGFGRGEYQYFAAPLPEPVTTLRSQVYSRVVGLANGWPRASSADAGYPPTLEEFSARCRAAAQNRPTPLLLKYGQGDFNRLHQDLYGTCVFPLQLTVLLSARESDFRGGEFVLTEQRPRCQSRVHVVPLDRGDAILFAVNERPVVGARGASRARMRHGVSTVLAGERYALGVIFHDAQ